MKEWTGEAKTAEAALALGLKKLGLSPEQVDMKVLGERTSGLLSLFGFHQVKVRLTEKVRRFDRGERADRDEEFDRSSNTLEYRRSGPKGRREERKTESKPVRSAERDRRERSSETPTPPPRRLPKETVPTPPQPKTDRNRERRTPKPFSSGRRSAAKSAVPENVPTGGPGELKRAPRSGATGLPFHPSVPPESLLTQWRELLRWEDMVWELKPVENHRLPIELKTSQGERLAGNGGRVLEAFEYLFNLVSSGGDREQPWVSFRVAGFPSAEESRVVDKALFAAFQVRRTAKMFHLDPMSPGQRRAVHQTLVNHPDVETFSEGEGPTRHVVVKLKGKKD